MEGSFADAANNHHYKRARWRGLANMRIQNLLVAACQNLRKLLKAEKRRKTPANRLIPTENRLRDTRRRVAPPPILSSTRPFPSSAWDVGIIRPLAMRCRNSWKNSRDKIPQRLV